MRSPGSSWPTTHSKPACAPSADRVARDVRRAAEAIFLALHVHDRHRRFRRNAVHVAEPVTVEHHVADHQHARRAELLARHHRELRRRRGRAASGMASDIGRKFRGLGIRASNRVIVDAEFGHHVRLVQIAAVENHGDFSMDFRCGEIRALEFLPFGDDHQRVGAGQRFVLRAREVQTRELLRASADPARTRGALRPSRPDRRRAPVAPRASSSAITRGSALRACRRYSA